MKKTFSKVSSVIVSLLVVFSLVPSAYSQELDVASVLTNITEANQTIPSMAGDGQFSFTVSDSSGELFGGDGTADFRFNVEPRFSMELDGNLNIREQVVNYNEDGTAGESELQETALAGTVTVLDGILYAFDGSTWTVEDISQQEQEISDQIYTATQQAASQTPEITEEYVATYQKYFDITETETDYVFSLKPDINSDEFWADMETLTGIDIEQLKQDALDEAIAQAEAQGTELTDEEIAQFEQYYEMGFDLVFALYDRLEVAYNKDNYYLSNMVLELSIDQNDIAEILGATEEDLGNETFLAEFMLSLNFTEHGQTFDITVPEGAPTFDESQSSQEASSETGESASEEVSSDEASEVSSEESVPTEETSEISSEESVE